MKEEIEEKKDDSKKEKEKKKEEIEERKEEKIEEIKEEIEVKKEENKGEIKEEIEERKEENIEKEENKELEEKKEEINEEKEEIQKEKIEEKKEEIEEKRKVEQRDDNIEEKKEELNMLKEEQKLEIEAEEKEKMKEEKKEEKEEVKKENRVEKEEENSIEIISEKELEQKNEITEIKKEENNISKNRMENEIEKENIKDNESKKEINEINNGKEENESKIISEKEEIQGFNNEIEKQEEGLLEEIENNKEEKKSNYKVDYYRENIFNLLNQLENNIPLNNVPDFLKRAFAMNESLYTEQFYFKGIFPKIIVSRNSSEEYKIKGMLSFYYENNEDLNENLIIRINSILVSQDYEEQIIEMIKFIINNVESDKIIVYILYDKIEDKFVANSNAKELFENKLKFKWYCVVRDEKMNQRYIKYYYSKKEENYDINEDNHEITKVENSTQHNKNNFMMDNLLITSINQENYNDLLKQNFAKKINYNKFINVNSLYYLLLQCNNIKIDFNDETKKNELFSMSEKVMKYSKYEYYLENSEKSKIIRNNGDEIDKSIYEEIKKHFQLNNIECSANLLKTNLFVNFESTYSMIIDQIYYNRISSDKIKILEEEKTGAKFFLIPSKDNNILFYISKINNKLKELLLDNTKNIYEKFLEFQPSTQKQIFEFSLKSYRDVSYIPLIPKQSIKTIYIPCFSFKTHLYSYDSKNLKTIMKLTEKNSESPLNIISIDEFINIEFKPDNNLINSFTTVESHDLIIDDSFIIGIFDNDIINDQKLPLLQFLYVTKDNFLTKSS